MTTTNISALTDSLRAAGSGTISRPRLGISRGMLTGYICACATCAICAIALWGNLLGGDDGTGGGVRGHPGGYNSVVRGEPNPYETNRYSPVSPEVVMKSRSTDDEGGNGPTFIKELVAVAEGTSEMYDVDLVKKPDPTRCAFALRPDGLGNRLEQIMNMAEVADSEDWAASSVLLFWQTNRVGKGRESGFSGTSGLLDIDNVRFMESRNAERTRRTLHVKECTLNADRAVMSRNAHRIRPAFGLHFADGDDQEIHPVGIHIRKSDRIALSPSSSGYETIDEFNAVVRFVTEAIVSKRPQHVFIASDDANEKAALATTLKAANISVVEPSVESLAGSTIPPLFSDFFGLSLCSEVWMASKFSSYAIMSARANGRDAPLYTYYDPEETILHRYQVPDVRLMRNWESYE